MGAALWDTLEANKEGEGGGAGGGARGPAHQLKQPDQVSTLKVHCSVCTDFSGTLLKITYTIAWMNFSHHISISSPIPTVQFLIVCSVQKQKGKARGGSRIIKKWGLVHRDGTCLGRPILRRMGGGGSGNTIFELGPSSKWHSNVDESSKHA